MSNINGYYYWFDIKAPASLVEDVKLIVEKEIKEATANDLNAFVLRVFSDALKSTEQLKGYYLEDDVAVTVREGVDDASIVMDETLMVRSKVRPLRVSRFPDTKGFEAGYGTSVTVARYFQEIDVSSAQDSTNVTKTYLIGSYHNYGGDQIYGI